MLSLPLSKAAAPQREFATESTGLESRGAGSSYPETLKEMIRAYAVDDRWLSVEQASELAFTSIRTLQRRLALEGGAFSRVLEDTRAQIAGNLLARTDAPIAEISGHLGYTKQSNFTRAFHRWAGVSPSAFRRQRRPV
jgi:AraC-like DNA-binding protein